MLAVRVYFALLDYPTGICRRRLGFADPAGGRGRTWVYLMQRMFLLCLMLGQVGEEHALHLHLDKQVRYELS